MTKNLRGAVLASFTVTSRSFHNADRGTALYVRTGLNVQQHHLINGGILIFALILLPRLADRLVCSLST